MIKLIEISNREGNKIVLKSPLEIKVEKNERYGYMAETDAIDVYGISGLEEGSEEDAVQDLCDDLHFIYELYKESESGLDDYGCNDSAKANEFFKNNLEKYEQKV